MQLIGALSDTGTQQPRPLSSSCTAPLVKCAAGQFFTAKTAAVPAKCTACPEGKYNTNDDASTACTAWTACTATGVATKGDATKDAVCKKEDGPKEAKEESSDLSPAGIVASTPWFGILQWAVLMLMMTSAV